ncbi:MAG: beta-galactosidase, partial [Candidatus Omnitrophica bacterium]|nr:beta-galactosidase [Candidatus Omnitrophota bacterium]
MEEKKFLLATQYYRAPTPLPEEWEEDIVNIKKIGFEAIQLRIQWRWNEKKEGIYNFDDIDRLFDLAEKTNLEVIIKFMLETAPEYIYRKYS